MMTDAFFLPGGVAAVRKEAEKSINQMPQYVIGAQKSAKAAKSAPE
jgi:hypothetical protein